MSYIYDTKIIYGDRSDSSIFTWNGFTYYLTKTGKPKKKDESGKILLIKIEEYRLLKSKYNEAMGI